MIHIYVVPFNGAMRNVGAVSRSPLPIGAPPEHNNSKYSLFQDRKYIHQLTKPLSLRLYNTTHTDNLALSASSFTGCLSTPT